MNGTQNSGKMDEAEKCPQCGAPLPSGVLEGLCPACLLQQGASADTGTQPETPPFEPPTVTELARLFPQLEILGLLGKGGMGAVYKARQPALDRLVALKILPPQVGSGAGFADRFTREARALARLSHPNIVAVHEFGQVGGLSYFIMEYVDGTNLRQLEQAGRLSPREALQIVPQICDALQYAHDEGVVHRDIKPENVLVDRKGRVKIADFGLAKILGREPTALRLTGEGQVMGTPHYMAPEQIEHPLQVDHRADIYALGVVFYEMLTGELPLGKFAPPSGKVEVDVRLDEVVLRSLEKEPERRYQQASQVKSDVETIAGSPPKPRPPQAETLVMESAAADAGILKQVKGPAIGLVVTGILNWILIPLAALLLLPHAARSAKEMGYSQAVVLIVALFPLFLCSFPIFAALKMKRLEAYWAAVTASILSIIIAPGNIVGLPVGLWALSVLTRKEVREAFAGKNGGKASRLPLVWLLAAGSVLALIGLVVGILTWDQTGWEQIGKGPLLTQAVGASFSARLPAETVELVAASAEVWAPTLGPGEKADPEKVRAEGRDLMSKGQYEDALQRFIWYWNHAIEYSQACRGVRLSFFLADWVELSQRYPKAKQALLEVRDQDTRAFLEGRGYFDLFMDLRGINDCLQKEEATYELFKIIEARDRALAKECFFAVRALLIKHRDYAAYLGYVGDVQKWFLQIQQTWNFDKAYQQKQGKENLHPAAVLTPENANDRFVTATRELIEALVGAGRKAEAEKIRDEAVKLLDDPRLKSAIQDAEKKIGER